MGFTHLASLTKGAELPDCIEKVESAVKDKYIDCDTYICMRVFAELKYPKEVKLNI